jgi:hypothetical protein
VNEYLPLVLFFIFFVLPILERVLKGSGKQEPPPDQRSRPRRDEEIGSGGLQTRRGGQGSGVDPAQAGQRGPFDGTSPHQPAADEASDASDMIPDDLWEILTGERRQRPAQGPPVPAPEAGLPYGSGHEEQEEPGWYSYEDEPEVSPAPAAGSDRWHTGHSAEGRRVESAREDHERGVHSADRAPVHEAPPLHVFDVASVPTDRARHAAFHRRFDEVKSEPPARRPERLFHLRSRDELRRAIIMKEILGRPKGLE